MLVSLSQEHPRGCRLQAWGSGTMRALRAYWLPISLSTILCNVIVLTQGFGSVNLSWDPSLPSLQAPRSGKTEAHGGPLGCGGGSRHFLSLTSNWILPSKALEFVKSFQKYFIKNMSGQGDGPAVKAHCKCEDLRSEPQKAQKGQVVVAASL